MRNRRFQDSRARDCREIGELRSFSSLEAEKARQSRVEELSTHQGRSPGVVNQLVCGISGIEEQGEFFARRRTLKDRGALEHLTLPLDH